MKLLFLGTGAADWHFNPEEEMTAEDRRRCSLLIDDHILMDVWERSYDYAKRLGVDTSAITDVVISHSHGDHFNKECLLKYRKDHDGKINVWCHYGAIKYLGLTEEEKELFEIHPVGAGEHYDMSGYNLFALLANHKMQAPERAMHYVFEKDGKRLFYGCDGSWFLKDTWEQMKRLKFDCMILDATFGNVWNKVFGDLVITEGHNTITTIELMLLPQFRANGILKEGGILIADHFSMLTNEKRQEHEKIYADMGMCAAYDGMEVTF